MLFGAHEVIDFFICHFAKERMVIEKLKEGIEELKGDHEKVKPFEELAVVDNVKIMAKFEDIYFWAYDLDF